jgi:hypothetical protein
VVTFTARGGFQPFSLPRKAAQVQQHNRGPEWVTIKSIEPVESVPVKCVAVASDDHLFLAGPAGTVTHNTHLWTLPALKRLHGTVTRNLMKRRVANGWSLETTTMFSPGEDSVAEETFKTAGQIDSVLLDHKEAPTGTDIKDDDSLRRALKYVYGPAAVWMDLDGLMEQFHDPQNRESDLRRYWLNMPWSTEDKFTTPNAWDVLEDITRNPEPGARIVIGFDGSFNNDSTALVGITLTEQPHVFLIDAWEKDQMSPIDWTVDILDVEQAIRNACVKYDVVELTADPSRWERSLQILMDEGVNVTRFPQTPERMDPATAGFGDLIATAGMTHDGDLRLRRHVLNACLRNDSRGKRLYKENKNSANKIDIAVATAMGLARAGALVNVTEDVAHVYYPDDFIVARQPAQGRPPGVPTSELPLGAEQLGWLQQQYAAQQESTV